MAAGPYDTTGPVMGSPLAGGCAHTRALAQRRKSWGNIGSWTLNLPPKHQHIQHGEGRLAPSMELGDGIASRCVGSWDQMFHVERVHVDGVLDMEPIADCWRSLGTE